MSELRGYLWLVPGLPLLAAALTALAGPRLLRRHSHWPCILASLAAGVLSMMVLAAVAGGGEAVERYDTWFAIGGLDVGVTLRADGLSAIMLVTVTLVGSLIAIYSVGYMAGDPGYARYFAIIALFIFSMTGLVLASNFFLLFAFWEGVGLCSYLLVGFWFLKPAAAAAARKAFLVTRLGDVGFILGILLIWSGFVYPHDPARFPGGSRIEDPTTGVVLLGHAVDYDTVFRGAEAQAPGLLAAVCLLLLCGAVGKSAQFPLSVWLPDAMEGPSPVSALIHAATMVTAGVYLVARSLPLFSAAPLYVPLTVAVLGTGTAMWAALIALTQNDLKRVLAYSTISQLGYMFLALGSATTKGLAAVAAVAAIFHLVTHAFFKALLFLGAGSVMHAMGNVIDMRRLGGLRHVLPITHVTFLCGAAALAGVPLLSGFWSKDEILGVAWAAGQTGQPFQSVYRVLFAVGLLTAGLTAFYTFRAYFLTFWGDERLPPEAGHHAHESPWVMTVPLVILAGGAVVAGLVLEPLTHWMSRLLGEHWLVMFGLALSGEALNHRWGVMALSSLVALAGVGLAWWLYGADLRREMVHRLAQRFPSLYEASLNKFYVDELYAFFIVAPMTALAAFCRIFDQYIVDSLVDLMGHVPGLVGRLLRPIQNGLVQFYALAMMLGLTVFLGALVWRLAR
ncbi:MAG: NADH-quinone oxidoreductase subunit L [Gemmataceae bacterium]|nr:NADH-quinone oxidoreductase subunit L [Gemmataceae bacterium]MDW8267344.1 NADH-quinone oxidoreductase subunit L [Gemmataceae bacterium]